MPRDIGVLSSTLSRMRLVVTCYPDSYVYDDTEEEEIEARDGTGLLGALLVAGEMMERYQDRDRGRIEIRPEGAPQNDDTNDDNETLVSIKKSDEYGYWYITKFPTT